MDLKVLENYMKVLADEEQPCAVLLTYDPALDAFNAVIVGLPVPVPGAAMHTLLDRNGEMYMAAMGGNISESLDQLNNIEQQAIWKEAAGG